MYLRPFTQWQDRDQIIDLVTQVAVAQLITVDAQGFPASTLLPILWDGGERVIAHAAKGNSQFQDLQPDAPALAVVSGPDAYINPAWYPSTAQSHRSVPTWNYLSVQLRGTLSVHTDPDWLLDAVTQLTHAHVGRHQPAWDLDHAPSAYLDGMVRGIIGLELRVSEVQAKAKLSQNRTRTDQEAIISGLAAETRVGASGIAEHMRARLGNA